MVKNFDSLPSHVIDIEVIKEIVIGMYMSGKNCVYGASYKLKPIYWLGSGLALNVVVVYEFEVYLIQDMRLMFSFLLDFDDRIVYIELAKPGGDAFGGYPRTSGLP